MSRTLFIHLSRGLALVALVGAGLVRPGVSFAQTVTGDRALLNQTADAADFTAAFNAIPGSGIGTGSNEVGGDRALLGRRETPRTWELPPVSLAQVVGELPIDGERALLGRWPVSQPRRPGDWAQRFAKEQGAKS